MHAEMQYQRSGDPSRSCCGYTEKSINELISEQEKCVDTKYIYNVFLSLQNWWKQKSCWDQHKRPHNISFNHIYKCFNQIRDICSVAKHFLSQKIHFSIKTKTHIALTHCVRIHVHWIIYLLKRFYWFN